MQPVNSYPIWEESAPYPSQAEMKEPQGIKHSLTHDGRQDILPFLHDLAVTALYGKIYQAWYNSTDAEICGSSLIRGRFSCDGGSSWSEPFTVIGSINAAEEHYVPVSFFPHDGKLYALITEMVGKNMTISLDLYEQQADPFEKWKKVSNVSGGFICNASPVRMNNGNYIVGAWIPMKEETPAFPVILISNGADIKKQWRCIFLYDPLHPQAVKIRCPEISLMADDNKITAFVRNDEGPSYVFISEDFGESWSAPCSNPMSIGNSKIYAGTLSNGKRYIVYNEERGYFIRTLMVIAVMERDSDRFSKVYKVFEDVDAEIGRGRTWFYPCTCEYDGNLYVACTLREADGVRSAVMAKIPVDSL